MDEDGNIQDYFDREGGLYYKNRLGEVNKIDV
jgi:isopenicillin N synthase-like dioxygenase